MSTNGTAKHEAPEAYRLVQIQTLEQLVQAWPFVRKGIERIRARDKSCGSWTHNQIYNAIRFGLPTAQPKSTAVDLFVATDASNIMRGFIVTTPKIDPFRNNVPIGLIVWLMYSPGDGYRLIELLLPSLENICRANGYDSIEFESGRRGWHRHFGRMFKLGFDIFQTRFRKEIAW